MFTGDVQSVYSHLNDPWWPVLSSLSTHVCVCVSHKFSVDKYVQYHYISLSFAFGFNWNSDKSIRQNLHSCSIQAWTAQVVMPSGYCGPHCQPLKTCAASVFAPTKSDVNHLAGNIFSMLQSVESETVFKRHFKVWEETAGRCWKMREGVGRCWKMLEDVGRCWKMLEARCRPNDRPLRGHQQVNFIQLSETKSNVEKQTRERVCLCTNREASLNPGRHWHCGSPKCVQMSLDFEISSGFRMHVQYVPQCIVFFAHSGHSVSISHNLCPHVFARPKVRLPGDSVGRSLAAEGCRAVSRTFAAQCQDVPAICATKCQNNPWR